MAEKTDLQKLVVSLEANVKNYERELRRASGVANTESRKIERRFEQMNAGISSGLAKLAGIVAGGLGAGLIGREFVRNTIEAEKALTQLNAVLRSTGGVVGLSSGELVDMAGGLQKVTAYGDDAIVKTQALMLTFTRISGEVFPQALEAVLNLSTAMGQDLKSSAVQVGKALNDPITGITALQRVGVQLSEQQKQQIKDFVAAGEVMKAQRVILAELETQFGGTARAARDTLGGALESLKNAYGDLFELPSESTRELKAEIERLIAVLQDPSTIGAIQGFGTELVRQIANAAEAWRLFTNNLRNMPQVDVIDRAKSLQSLRAMETEVEQLTKSSEVLRQKIASGSVGVSATDFMAPVQSDINVMKQELTSMERRLADLQPKIDSARHAIRAGDKQPPGSEDYAPFPGVPAAKPPPATPTTGTASSRSADALERENQQLEKRIELLKAEAETIGRGTLAQETAEAKTRLLNAAKQAGIPITDELRAKVDALATKYGEAAVKVEQAKDKFQALQEASREFASAGSEAFKGMVLEAKSLDEVLQQLIKRLASAAIDKMFMSLLGGIFTGGIGGGLFPFAQGGVMTPQGPLPLKRYATGGVANSPQLALYGEGRKPEAYVPLPDGRSIPVKLQMPRIPQPVAQRSSPPAVYSPVYHIDARGADAAAVARLERGLQQRDRTESSRFAAFAHRQQIRGVRP